MRSHGVKQCPMKIMGANILAATMAIISFAGAAPAQEIVLRSPLGEMQAVLGDNAAAEALFDQLPLTIAMRDHLRQEKTGELPSSLPDLPRQRVFSKGLLGLWGGNDFVIYYREGTVPSPGIVPLGKLTGDVTIFDHPDDITMELLPK